MTRTTVETMAMEKLYSNNSTVKQNAQTKANRGGLKCATM